MMEGVHCSLLLSWVSEEDGDGNEVMDVEGRDVVVVWGR